MRALFEAIRADAREWCAGRSWAWRAPILGYLAYAGLRHLGDASYSSWFGGITFGIHELGHVVMGWAGHFIAAAGGSFWQVALPMLCTFALLRQRDYFGVAVGACWTGFSLFNLATYVGDARAQELPLLGLSDDPEHDWHYLLGALGLLSLDHALAFLIRVLALATWAGGMTVGAWTCWVMARGGSSEAGGTRPSPRNAR